MKQEKKKKKEEEEGEDEAGLQAPINVLSPFDMMTTWA
jgi:hypothetical protein